MCNDIIDCHSHIGYDYFWKDASLDGYLEIMKLENISSGFLMPVPCPTFIDNNTKRYFYWSSTSKNKIVYNTDKKNNNLTNPYRKINDYTYQLIKKSSSQYKLEFIPLIHPRLDTIDELERLIYLYRPIALKMHGISGGYGSSDVSKRLLSFLKKFDLPIIVHTDYSNTIDNLKDRLMFENNSYDWARLFIDNDLRGYLTHGCRLDFDTFNLVNNNDNLVVGLGPDLKISNEKFRWTNRIENKEYLDILKDNLDISKLLFDIDYSWNVKDSKKNIDFCAIERIKNHFNEEEQEKILSKNAKRFFRIKENV